MKNQPTVFETVGSSVRSQFAQNGAGQWFKRSQYNDMRYGWKWSRWTPTSEPQKAEWVDGVPGCSDGAYSYGVLPANFQPAVRLPSFVEG